MKTVVTRSVCACRRESVHGGRRLKSFSPLTDEAHMQGSYRINSGRAIHDPLSLLVCLVTCRMLAAVLRLMPKEDTAF